MNYRHVVLLAAAFGLSLSAQTTVTQVSNAASYSNDIAQGSIFVVFGTNLGPAVLAQAPALPLATTLSGTSIKFTPTGGGAAVDAFMVYTSAGQLAGLLPSTTAVGNYNVTVTYNGSTSANFASRVVQRGYGMITLNSAGTGLAVMQNASAGLAVNVFSAPARPGQTMVLWGTGLGPVRVPDNAAPGVQDLRGDTTIRVLVGGVEVTPDYAGRSPDLPGADQINFVIPGSVPTGCTVNLQVRVGTETSPPANIAIAPPGRAVCEHPFLSEDALRRLDARGDVTYGSFGLSSQSISISFPGLPISFDQRSESVGGAFQKLTLGNLAEVSAEAFPTIGSCTVFKQRTDQSGEAVIGAVTALDAGTISLNGPNVNNRTVTKAMGNYYSLSLSPTVTPGQSAPAVIVAGTYTLTGAGGADIGPFTASVRLNSPINWTNRTQISTIVRTTPLTVNWTGGSASDLVTITGVGGRRVAGTSDENPLFDTTVFVCYAPGTAGTFTVPTSVLQQLPQVDGLIGGGTTTGDGIGLLSVAATLANIDGGKFNAPLTKGGNIDFGFFTYSIGGATLVAIR